MKHTSRYSWQFLAAMGMLLILMIISLLPTPCDYEYQDLDNRFLQPFSGDGAHPLGTDHLGRDLLSRMMMGIRTSYLIALLGTVIGAAFGTMMGFFASRMRGIVDELIMMLVDIQASLPFLLVAMAFLSLFSNSLVVIVVLLGFAGWEKYARLTRSMALSAMKYGYSTAVHSLGASQGRIFFRHILPNISSALIVNMTLNFPGTMIAESSLSFLGLGIQPPVVSLGRLLGEGRVYLMTAWWITVLPGLVIFASTLAMSFIGDWARDRLGTQ